MSRPRRKAITLVLATLVLAGCAASSAPSVRSGLEQSGWQRPSTPEEVGSFLNEIAQHHPNADVTTIGRSAGGRPILALRIAARKTDDAPRLRMMIIGSQHGTEPSGGEAIQELARDILSGDAGEFEDMDFFLIPDSNPDGRAIRRRVNANGVNLSTNYTTLSEPEARAVSDSLRRFQPHVLIDVHESAILKKKSLGAQGYMTDFEAQIEIANNPNVDPELEALGERLLPIVVERVIDEGVPSNHYIGEITDIAQPITHGGVSIKNLRNVAGLRGTLSFLIENRLDPPGEFATPRNIRERARKQLVSITAILEACDEDGEEIIATVDRVRARGTKPGNAPVELVASYAPNAATPQIVLPLRRIADMQIEQRTFALHDVVEAPLPLEAPQAYAVVAHQDRIAELLDRQGISYERLERPRNVRVTALLIEKRIPKPAPHGWGYTDYDIALRERVEVIPAGALWIPLAQPSGRMIPLLLEPRSNAGAFQDPSYAPLIELRKELFIRRVE